MCPGRLDLRYVVEDLLSSSCLIASASIVIVMDLECWRVMDKPNRKLWLLISSTSVAYSEAWTMSCDDSAVAGTPLHALELGWPFSVFWHL